tara:strand:- start:1695 stop:2351 length:657 start_codon:yes stop_codon:yes gene_type:complete
MGLFSRTKVRYNMNVGSDVLTDELLGKLRGVVRTDEAMAAYGAAQDVYGAASQAYQEFDRGGDFSRAAVSSSRRNLVRTGALSGGQMRGRQSLMELGAAMNEASAGTLMAVEQARGARMQAMMQGAGLLQQSAQAMSINPFVQTAMQGAYSMEQARMVQQAQADAAHKQMMMGAIAGVATGAMGMMGGGLAGSFGANKVLGGMGRGMYRMATGADWEG